MVGKTNGQIDIDTDRVVDRKADIRIQVDTLLYREHQNILNLVKLLSFS